MPTAFDWALFLQLSFLNEDSDLRRRACLYVIDIIRVYLGANPRKKDLEHVDNSRIRKTLMDDPLFEFFYVNID